MQAHREWASRPADERFQSLEALTASVMDRRMRSRSIDVDLGKVSAAAPDPESGAIVINRGFASVEPTHWSFGQLAGWIHAPGDYLRRLPAPLAVENINYGIKAAAQERGALKFMAVAQDGQPYNRLQAVTSTTYGRIWDADVCQAVQRIQERTNGKFHAPLAYAGGKFGAAPVPSGLYASDRDCFIFMVDGGSLLEAGPRAKINRGFITWNSETGSRTFGLCTFLFNQVCGNHIIWGASNINQILIRHTAGGPNRFDTEAAPRLLEYVNAGAGPELDTIKRAQNYLIGDKPLNTEDLTKWIQAHGKFSRSECTGAIEHARTEEGEARTLFQVVQGFTAYARGFDWADTRIDLEKRAGALLDLAAATKN